MTTLPIARPRAWKYPCFLARHFLRHRKRQCRSCACRFNIVCIDGKDHLPSCCWRLGFCVWGKTPGRIREAWLSSSGLPPNPGRALPPNSLIRWWIRSACIVLYSVIKADTHVLLPRFTVEIVSSQRLPIRYKLYRKQINKLRSCVWIASHKRFSKGSSKSWHWRFTFGYGYCG